MPTFQSHKNQDSIHSSNSSFLHDCQLEILPFKCPKLTLHIQWQNLNLTSFTQQEETHEATKSKVCQWPPPPPIRCPPGRTIIASARPSGSPSVLVSPCSPAWKAPVSWGPKHWTTHSVFSMKWTNKKLQQKSKRPQNWPYLSIWLFWKAGFFFFCFSTLDFLVLSSRCKFQWPQEPVSLFISGYPPHATSPGNRALLRDD